MLFWHVPAPNEALLISGSKRHKDATQFRIVTGHGSFVMPIKQRARLLSLALREAEITEECITNQGIRLNVRAVAAFKVGDDSVSIAAGLVGQGMSILDLLKKSAITAPVPSANGTAQDALGKIA